jgi:hypothetical protein
MDLHAIVPGVITGDPNNVYKDISQDMLNLKIQIIEKVEDNMALRSNFEFSCENKNLLQDKSLVKKIQQGISILRNYSVINADIENNVRKQLNLIT